MDSPVDVFQRGPTQDIENGNGFGAEDGAANTGAGRKRTLAEFQAENPDAEEGRTGPSRRQRTHNRNGARYNPYDRTGSRINRMRRNGFSALNRNQEVGGTDQFENNQQSDSNGQIQPPMTEDFPSI